MLVAAAEGYMDVYSENSYGVCVPLNSSANEVIVGMARAAALSSSGEIGPGTCPRCPVHPDRCSSNHPKHLADHHLVSCMPAAEG